MPGGIVVRLAKLTPLVLDRGLQLAHSCRGVLLRTGFDRTPVDQTLLEQPVLPLLPEMQRQAEPVDLGLQFSEAAIELGTILHRLIHEASYTRVRVVLRLDNRAKPVTLDPLQRTIILVSAAAQEQQP